MYECNKVVQCINIVESCTMCGYDDKRIFSGYIQKMEFVEKQNDLMLKHWSLIIGFWHIGFVFRPQFFCPLIWHPILGTWVCHYGTMCHIHLWPRYDIDFWPQYQNYIFTMNLCLGKIIFACWNEIKNIHSSWWYLKLFFSRTTKPITTKICTKHSRAKGIQVCTNEGPHPFPGGDNYEIAKTHWWNLKIFFSRSTWQLSTKLGIKHLWEKGIQICSNRRPYPFPRGDNNEIVKIHWQSFSQVSLV